MSRLFKFQRWTNKDVSPKKHTLRGPGGKYVSASEIPQKMEERTISMSKPKVRKVESAEDDCDFECYSKSDGKSKHVDVRNKVIMSTKPNKSEEEEKGNNGEIMDGNGIFGLRRSNRTFKRLDRFGSGTYFWKLFLLCTGPTRKEPPKPRLRTREEMDLDEGYDPDDDK